MKAKPFITLNINAKQSDEIAKLLLEAAYFAKCGIAANPLLNGAMPDKAKAKRAMQYAKLFSKARII